MSERKKLPTYLSAAGISGLALLSAVWLAGRFGQELLIWRFSGELLIWLWAVYAFAAVVVFLSAKLAAGGGLARAAGAFAMLLIAAGVCILALFLCLFRCFGYYHTFRSPDGRHKLVAFEKCLLFSGDVFLYERKTPLTVERKTRLGVCDCAYPIKEGAYSVKWDGDEAVFSMLDYSGRGCWVNVRIKMGSHDRPEWWEEFRPWGWRPETQRATDSCLRVRRACAMMYAR